ncbi:DUF1902 domain-containing protein [Propionivibrio sp.]|uniref:DUF1902 domain-containing protein n=1 Tax=Propionivibrio sp. TaxID=2212460 RepID=UPI003BF06BDC
MITFTIKAEWDEEARVWYVADSNVPGLSTEAPTAEALLEKLKVMLPELLELNDGHEYACVPFELIAHRSAQANHCH